MLLNIILRMPHEVLRSLAAALEQACRRCVFSTRLLTAHESCATRWSKTDAVSTNLSPECGVGVAFMKGEDTKIELGFSMTLAGATPGIHPEGRRLGALRLGRRLETPKSQVWFLRITGELRPVMGFTAF